MVKIKQNCASLGQRQELGQCPKKSVYKLRAWQRLWLGCGMNEANLGFTGAKAVFGTVSQKVCIYINKGQGIVRMWFE